jgi:hypothetical protein
MRSVSTDPVLPGADDVLRNAIQNGAVSVGELKHHLALDSPEMRRVYDICAEMRAPVMMHIQNFPHWSHISAIVPTDRGYPSGPIKPGGLTDKFLADYPNLYADMSANSGNNALSRDTEPGISLSSGCWPVKITRTGHRIEDLSRDIGLQ